MKNNSLNTLSVFCKSYNIDLYVVNLKLENKVCEMWELQELLAYLYSMRKENKNAVIQLSIKEESSIGNFITVDAIIIKNYRFKINDK